MSRSRRQPSWRRLAGSAPGHRPSHRAPSGPWGPIIVLIAVAAGICVGAGLTWTLQAIDTAARLGLLEQGAP